MKVEILIYSYLAVCVAMIGFNIACIFVFKYKDKRIDRYSQDFIDQIEEQIKLQNVSDAHKKYLHKKLKRVSNLMAFDKTINKMFEERPDEAYNYLVAISTVFMDLTPEYLKKNEIQSAYFPYIIKKHGLFRGQNNAIIIRSMLELVGSSSLYCRENALNALYSIGLARPVVDALKVLDKNSYYHNPKLITDGLLNFAGDEEELSDLLWASLGDFSERMQVSILDYFRFSSDRHCERMLKLFASQSKYDETTFSCIRYFGKYRYQPAYPYLLAFLRNLNESQWEYYAVTASTLATYPGETTTQVLKDMLYSKNWFIRYNASMSLEKLGIDYADLIDIFESDDRYASEIMRYRFDQKRMREKELETNAK